MQLRSINEIETASRDELIALWRETYHRPPPRGISAPMMRRFLAFDIQAAEHGGLPKGFQAALEKRASMENRKRGKQLQDGTRFIREWNGRTHTVDLVDGRYQWNGQSYRSLSAIAREITGAHWSGPRFFGSAEGQSH